MLFWLLYVFLFIKPCAFVFVSSLCPVTSLVCYSLFCVSFMIGFASYTGLYSCISKPIISMFSFLLVLNRVCIQPTHMDMPMIRLYDVMSWTRGDKRQNTENEKKMKHYPERLVERWFIFIYIHLFKEYTGQMAAFQCELRTTAVYCAVLGGILYSRKTKTYVFPQHPRTL